MPRNKRRLTPGRLEALYRLLSSPMLDFDCASLCAPKNKGVPLCCDQREVIPLMYRDELKWHRERSSFWKRMPRKTKDDSALAEENESDHDVLAVCPGPSKCVRSKRALVCRTFPFEPHCDTRGNVLGITYIYSKEHTCPLIDRKNWRVNPTYVRNSIKYWEQIFELFPEEQELYVSESKKIRRQFKRKARKLPLFS